MLITPLHNPAFFAGLGFGDIAAGGIQYVAQVPAGVPKWAATMSSWLYSPESARAKDSAPGKRTAAGIRERSIFDHGSNEQQQEQEKPREKYMPGRKTAPGNE